MCPPLLFPALSTRVALPCSLCSHVSLPCLHMQADLAHRNQQVEQLSHKVADHNEVMSKLRADLDSEVARKTELEGSLDRTTKEKNHWQQKSVQQDMVIQTTRQVIISFCTICTSTGIHVINKNFVLCPSHRMWTGYIVK